MEPVHFVHKPVLFQETIDSLAIRPEGTYIDGTAGGGGHSEAILQRLTTGTLLSIDQDPDAIARLHRAAFPVSRVGNPAGQFLPNGRNRCWLRHPGGRRGAAGYRGVLLSAGYAGAGIFLPC